MADMTRTNIVSRRDDSRLPQLDREVVRRAQQAVLSHVDNADEAEMLLNMLGLHPNDWNDNGDV